MARLPIKDQLPLYSAFLTGTPDREGQRLCLYLGREAGLDMDKVVVASVTKARHEGGHGREWGRTCPPWLSGSTCLCRPT